MRSAIRRLWRFMTCRHEHVLSARVKVFSVHSDQSATLGIYSCVDCGKVATDKAILIAKERAA